jgi:hypothetical protein
MKTMKFECDDRYEAEKLAGLVSVQKDDAIYIDGVAAVIANEIVIKLKDKSSHAVIMKDKESAGRLQTLLLDIIDGKARIHSSDFAGPVAEITLKD